jgi:hypothetical protein
MPPASKLVSPSIPVLSMFARVSPLTPSFFTIASTACLNARARGANTVYR